MAIDQIGKRYGRWVVLERDFSKKKPYWFCRCDCGKIKSVDGYSLRSGASKSCGCRQKEIVSKINEKNLIGQRFGKLVVISKTKERKFGYIIWECQCDCGRIHYVTSNNLTMGQVKSCGQCGYSHNSIGQEKIKTILIENNIPFITEKTFSDCYYLAKNAKLRFDFFVDNKYLIEFDGKQHFIKDSGYGQDLENIQIRDSIKNSYCLENNIPLIRIPYTKIESLTLKDLLLDTTNFLIKKDFKND